MGQWAVAKEAVNFVEGVGGCRERCGQEHSEGGVGGVLTIPFSGSRGCLGTRSQCMSVML